jgi:hypothetical protein
MKSSLVRGIAFFIAGAICASAVAAGLKVGREGLTPSQFEEHAIHLLDELADLGLYVAVLKDGHVGIYSGPREACVIPPKPNVNPPGVDPRLLKAALGALAAMQHGYEQGQKDMVFIKGKCWPADPQ